MGVPYPSKEGGFVIFLRGTCNVVVEPVGRLFAGSIAAGGASIAPFVYMESPRHLGITCHTLSIHFITCLSMARVRPVSLRINFASLLQ